MGLCWWLSYKESACNRGDAGSTPGARRSLEEGMTTHSSVCLENPIDRGAWRATVHGVAKSRTRLKPLSMHPYTWVKYHILKHYNFIPFTIYILCFFLIRIQKTIKGRSSSVKIPNTRQQSLYNPKPTTWS